MNTAKILNFPEHELVQAPREELITMVQTLRTENIALRKKLAEKDAELEKQTKKAINKTANQPTSKQAEFDKKTGATKKSRKRRHAGRKGAGNKSKPAPDVVHENALNKCPECQNDLAGQPVVEAVSRIVEDIAPIPEKTIVSKEVQERKWCPTCSKLVASCSEAALPRSDIGVRAMCLIAYLWVVSAISMPGIVAFLQSFFRLQLSTAGLSRMMIRLANIFAPVYEEILEDTKGGKVIFADETGWRVKGVLWWLWIFANSRAAYYFPDRRRGSAVVEKILGTIFSGVLVTDAWVAYRKIECLKQTCMAHILRKIRKFRDAYPQYRSVISFYQKLRRILRDGDRLKEAYQKAKIEKQVFLRRLDLLKARLAQLLAWRRPNPVLKEIIAKVARQQEYILTFVEHEGVPNHNNYGEYIIKKGVLKRKVSGGSMSEEGVKAYAVLQSIAQTCHLRRLSFIGYMTASCLHFIRTDKPLSLKDYEIMCATNTRKADTQTSAATIRDLAA